VLGAVVRSSDERFIRRIQSRDRGTPRQDSFRRAVRARYQKCVITGIENSEAEVDNWEGFEAAHIFPLEREALWKQCNFNQFVTLPARHPMNSVQNGLLLTSSVHQKFDSYAISVNPDVSQSTKVSDELFAKLCLGWVQDYGFSWRCLQRRWTNSRSRLPRP
jgi:predicted restriction endonuclease